MTNPSTFDDIIEEHRQAVGAESVRVTLGPEATPEGVRDAFENIRRSRERFESFTELERKQAHVARLKGAMRRALKHTQRRIDVDHTKADLEKRLSNIFGELDMSLVIDSSLTEDTKWMVEQREKKGVPLPAVFSEQDVKVH